MKSIVLTIAFISLFSTASFAQEEGENPGFDQYSSSVFDKKENALNLVSKMNVAPSANTFNAANPSGVLIQQIGNFNQINADFKAANVNFAVVQEGSENLINVQKGAPAINQYMLQQGNNNTISDFTLYTSYNVNMEMVQRGDNSNIQNYGTNSLSKDMKINQTGSGAEIIIINQQ